MFVIGFIVFLDPQHFTNPIPKSTLVHQQNPNRDRYQSQHSRDLQEHVTILADKAATVFEDEDMVEFMQQVGVDEIKNENQQNIFAATLSPSSSQVHTLWKAYQGTLGMRTAISALGADLPQNMKVEAK